ncbi:MAG: hypothetical protein ACREQJ_01560, partial [Candidatus Binatia bacterium]
MAVADDGARAALAMTVMPMPDDNKNVFQKFGDYWAVKYAGAVTLVPDLKGLTYLSDLLRNPGRKLPVTSLAGFSTVGLSTLDQERLRKAVSNRIRHAIR